ncbi:helix-turn-helix domain-containing protein [Streptomyces verrucosisporus]|uniref:helix-turn-helix domain-containing protein n=1 Tax=Streptomyces verrucosisporus TaxID=1695161 RepID=UPI00355871BA
MNHARWRTRRTRRLLGEAVEESPAYAEAGHAFALGRAVYDRRTELGFSQTELARRAGMTQQRISTIEGGRLGADPASADPPDQGTGRLAGRRVGR